MTLTHRKTGISDHEWIRRSLNEARSDPVGMWQIVRAGRDGFGLTGIALEDFVRRFIAEMVAGGAGPIVGDKEAPFGWSPTARFGVEAEDVAQFLVDDWKSSGVDPDVDGVWFAFPSAWK
jgi:hypothetical protein